MTQVTNATARTSAVILRSPLAALAALPGWEPSGASADASRIASDCVHLAEIQIGGTDEGWMTVCREGICMQRRWLADRSPEVLDAALAHEAGHLERVNGARALAAAVALRAAETVSMVMFGAAGFSVLHRAFAGAAALLGAGLLIGHIRSHLCRRHEYAADRYALTVVGPAQMTGYLADLAPSEPTRPAHWLRLALGLAVRPSSAARIKRLQDPAAHA